MDSEQYHVPVMLEEALEGLSLRSDGTYVDVTFGGGGHSRAILERLGEGGRLLAFDQDSDAVECVNALMRECVSADAPGQLSTFHFPLSTYVNTGDWLTHRSYAVFDPATGILELKEY